MSDPLPLVWLVGAVAAGALAWWIGWPAWRASRERAARDLNAERYLAWRGRAVRRDAPRAGLTAAERRRLATSAALAVIGVASVVAFFLASA